MTQFLPYMMFLASTVNFYLVALDEKHFRNDSNATHWIYWPYLGFCSVLLINQIESERIQLRNEKSWLAYFTSIWNLNDQAYMLCGVFLFVVNAFDLIPMREQRSVAAFASIFMWLKVLDWSRLFN